MLVWHLWYIGMLALLPATYLAVHVIRRKKSENPIEETGDLTEDTTEGLDAENERGGDLDTSKEITIHTLIPSRRVEETETDSHDVIEIDEGIVDISKVFTGPEGDMILHSKGCPIPHPFDKSKSAKDADPSDQKQLNEDPSVQLMNRQFSLGFYEKLSKIPSQPFSLSLGSLPAWAIVLIFIIVIFMLGG